MPKGFLAEAGVELKGQTRDCVLNRTLIDRETNNTIRMKAPAVYLKQMEDEMGSTALKDLLESHLLPSGVDSPLRAGDFEGFLATRQEMIWTQIKQVTQ